MTKKLFKISDQIRQNALTDDLLKTDGRRPVVAHIAGHLPPQPRSNNPDVEQLGCL